MSKSLSKDLRERVICAVEGGMTRRLAAARYGVAPSTAVKWVQEWRRSGRGEARPRGGDNRSHVIEAHGDEILALIDETPDMTLAEIVAHLKQAHGLVVSQSSVWRFFERHRVTLKKNRTRQRATAA